MKIGQSIDIHQLIEGRKLILGGVEIENELGLLGHSDADALLHAIIEAIIGALGLGDIGTHFPDTDSKYKDVSSLFLLAETYKMMDDMGFKIGNIDSIIVIERPKMAPYIKSMRENIAKTLKCDISLINVKATRAEKLGFIGEEKGVLAQAVVLVVEKE